MPTCYGAGVEQLSQAVVRRERKSTPRGSPSCLPLAPGLQHRGFWFPHIHLPFTPCTRPSSCSCCIRRCRRCCTLGLMLHLRFLQRGAPVLTALLGNGSAPLQKLPNLDRLPLAADNAPAPTRTKGQPDSQRRRPASRPEAWCCLSQRLHVGILSSSAGIPQVGAAACPGVCKETSLATCLCCRSSCPPAAVSAPASASGTSSVVPAGASTAMTWSLSLMHGRPSTSSSAQTHKHAHRPSITDVHAHVQLFLPHSSFFSRICRQPSSSMPVARHNGLQDSNRRCRQAGGQVAAVDCH